MYSTKGEEKKGGCWTRRPKDGEVGS